MRIKHTHYQPPAPAEPDLFSEPVCVHGVPQSINRFRGTHCADREPRLARPSVPVDTSEDAAASVKGLTNRMRAAILTFIKEFGGVTEEDVEVWLKLPGNSVRPRLWELEQMGKIVKSEDKRKNRSGRWARVYKAI